MSKIPNMVFPLIVVWFTGYDSSEPTSTPAVDTLTHSSLLSAEFSVASTVGGGDAVLIRIEMARASNFSV